MADDTQAMTPQTLAGLLHLSQQGMGSKTLASLGFVIANETLVLVNYRQASVFDVAVNGKYRLLTASGLVSVAEDSPFVVWLNRFAQTFPKSGSCISLSFSDAPTEFKEGWQEWLPDQLLVSPLADSDGRTAGLVMYAREEPWRDAELAMLKYLHLAYGHCMAALGQRREGVGYRTRLALQGRSKWIWAALAAILLIPVRLSALAPAEVVALNAMAVSAPQDGVVGAVYVQPNAPVKAGDALFSLVDTTLSSRREVALKGLAVARSEALTAEQRAFDDVKSKGELAAASGRVREKEAELAAADALLARVTVKAERDGLAVFVDPNDWLGRPVQTGERVMQLANPLDTGVLVWLPASDALNLETGAAIRLFLHTQPLSPLNAALYQTSYQATPSPDGIAAYKLYARFDNDLGKQRIGLRGTARVSGGWALLGYYIFRRPIAAVREWTGM